MSRKRVRSRAWFFTWNNPKIGGAQLADRIRENPDITDFVFQLEKAGQLHFQGVIRYKNPRDNYPELGDGFHWERCRNWRAAKKYCSKVESRYEGPWTNIEGLKFRETIRDPLKGVELYKWQSDVLKLIDTEPDDRKIFWYWDEVGNKGKSSLAKHIRMWHKCVVLNGTAKDCFCALKLRLEEDDVKIVIFDLTRSQRNMVSYRAIEAIKNGMFFSGKYESTDILMNSPHILVFANFEPNYEAMSDDRWSVTKIEISENDLWSDEEVDEEITEDGERWWNET